MAVKSSDAITVTFTLQRFDTGAASNADSLPTGTLYVDGTSNAATVTITNITTGLYKAAVTLPSLSTGNRCEIVVSATVNSVAAKNIIWRDACDIATDSSGHITVGNYASGKAPLQPTVAGRTLDVTATGGAGIDWSNVENASSTVTLSATTIKTATDVETDTQDIQSRIPAALVSGRMDASVGAYQSGLAPLQPTVSGRTLDVTATGAAGIDWANVENPTTTLVLSGTTIGTCTTNTDMRGTDGAALASAWTSTRAGYLDSVLLAQNSNQRTVQVTGSNHVAADVHETQPGAIHSTTFDAGAIDATAIAADAITAAKVAADVGTEIGTAVWSSTTRILTAGTNIVLAKGTGITGFNDITANAAADAILVRGAANVESSAEAYSLADMLLGVFESKVESGTWTIYRTDGTTTHRTKTITTDGTAEPITRVQ